MQILTKAHEIKQKLQWIFDDDSCERIVIVAFVGENAVEYLSNPEGIKLYCWPIIPGTNPSGLRKLKNQKVDLKGVKKLHSKIYWSKNRGCIIGSANLSSNALEDNKNIETCVYLPAGEVDINNILSNITLKSDPITNSDISKLERQFNAYSVKNPPQEFNKKHNINFPEWYENNKNNINIKLRYWDTEDDAPSDAPDDVKEQTGSTHFHDYIHGDNANSFKIGDWILELKENTTISNAVISELSWFIPNIRTVTKDKNWKYDKFIWYQTGKILIRRPFNTEDKILLKSINKSLLHFSATSETIKKTNEPKAKFLKIVYENYLHFQK